MYSMNYGTRDWWRRHKKNRRIEEAEHDRNEVEYERDRMWMADELMNLDLEAKLKVDRGRK